MSHFISREYPSTRLTRSRQAFWSRVLVAENTLTPADLIWPVFVPAGKGIREPIKTLPGVCRLSIDELLKDLKVPVELGVPAVALFPGIHVSLKTDDGEEALNPNNILCEAIRAIKAAHLNICVIWDVPLDPYTSHGHDGVLVDGKVHNDRTVDILRQQALVLATSGADVIAPSDMQDGRIAAIRTDLEAANFTNTLTLSYALKYASQFYGPFRDAVTFTI
jgi:Delta-aminolevulinic acid dehydratase